MEKTKTDKSGSFWGVWSAAGWGLVKTDNSKLDMNKTDKVVVFWVVAAGGRW